MTLCTVPFSPTQNQHEPPVLPQDLYAALGIKNLGYPTWKVPVELIHTAFEKQSARPHTDEFSALIQKAYETLSNESSRRQYDSVDVPEGYAVPTPGPFEYTLTRSS